MFAAKLLEKSENLLRMVFCSLFFWKFTLRGCLPLRSLKGSSLRQRRLSKFFPTLCAIPLRTATISRYIYFEWVPRPMIPQQEIVSVLKPCIASKQFGYEDFLAPIVAEVSSQAPSILFTQIVLWCLMRMLDSDYLDDNFYFWARSVLLPSLYHHVCLVSPAGVCLYHAERSYPPPVQRGQCPRLQNPGKWSFEFKLCAWHGISPWGWGHCQPCHGCQGTCFVVSRFTMWRINPCAVIFYIC